jgi:N-methylhydantoinase A/oxoprolinase/acetone carboxylase beta subunit
MSLVLGIDTGGTYTDGVILDISNQNHPHLSLITIAVFCNSAKYVPAASFP